MNELLKSNEELIDLYKKALHSTIREIMELKSSRKRTMALEAMWLKEQNQKCDRCPETSYLTVDHIIPASLLIQIGIESDLMFIPENYGVLCKRCNWFKANRLDFANPKTKPLLKEFVNNI